MKLSTGKVAFPIEFDNGDKDVIYFNPNDPDLMFRLKNMQENVSKKIKGLEDVELSNDGTPANSSQIVFFQKMQDALKEELDVAFGGSVSGIVFKHCSPFAIVNGEYFIAQFIQAITPEIERHIKKENDAIREKMQKHIGKYQ